MKYTHSSVLPIALDLAVSRLRGARAGGQSRAAMIAAMLRHRTGLARFRRAYGERCRAMYAATLVCANEFQRWSLDGGVLAEEARRVKDAALADADRLFHLLSVPGGEPGRRVRGSRLPERSHRHLALRLDAAVAARLPAAGIYLYVLDGPGEWIIYRHPLDVADIVGGARSGTALVNHPFILGRSGAPACAGELALARGASGIDAILTRTSGHFRPSMQALAAAAADLAGLLGAVEVQMVGGPSDAPGAWDSEIHTEIPS